MFPMIFIGISGAGAGERHDDGQCAGDAQGGDAGAVVPGGTLLLLQPHRPKGGWPTSPPPPKKPV